MPRRKRRSSGSAMVEFTLVGIPMVFVLISVFELARGMWLYHTLAYSIKEGARFAMVHGVNCDIPPNSCQTTVADVAQRIMDSGVGLIPDEFSITLRSDAGDVTCTVKPGCLGNNSRWPPPTNGLGQSGVNGVGRDIYVFGNYPFRSAISMLWPGTGPGTQFGVVNLTASSRETIQF